MIAGRVNPLNGRYRRAIIAIAVLGSVVGCGSGAPSLSDSVPTRPIGEPLVFRLTGYEHSVTNSASRYSVVWKLNRDPVAKLTFQQRNHENIPGNRGSYGLAGYELAEFKGVGAMAKPGCFGADVEAPLDPVQGRRLKRTPLGGRVKVELQPLTPTKNSAKSVLGKNYVFYAKMRAADHLLRSEGARRQLATIGC